MRACGVEGCGRRHHARGLCEDHWRKDPERVAYLRAWRRRNRKQQAEHNGEWRRNNAERVRAARRAWYARHKDEQRARVLEWQRRHADRVAEYKRKSRKQNPGRWRAKARRAHKRQAERISDRYVRKLIRKANHGLVGAHIPTKLIQLKRAELRLTRRLTQEKRNGG